MGSQGIREIRFICNTYIFSITFEGSNLSYAALVKYSASLVLASQSLKSRTGPAFGDVHCEN